MPSKWHDASCGDPNREGSSKRREATAAICHSESPASLGRQRLGKKTVDRCPQEGFEQ